MGHIEVHTPYGWVNLEDVRPTLPQEGLDALPEVLAGLIRRSSRLYDRILKINAMLNENGGEPTAQSTNPLDDQLERLKAAFGAPDNS